MFEKEPDAELKGAVPEGVKEPSLPGTVPGAVVFGAEYTLPEVSSGTVPVPGVFVEVVP